MWKGEQRRFVHQGFKFAVSNLFQVIKSKTAAGFVPNFAAGGLRSQDRTEPPIGAKVRICSSGNIYALPLRFKLGGRRVLSAPF
jgi:hypothetical protein